MKIDNRLKKLTDYFVANKKKNIFIKNDNDIKKQTPLQISYEIMCELPLPP